MPYTRRNFLKDSARFGVAGAVATSIPKPLLVRLGTASEPVPPVEDSRIKALAQHALDVAKSSGAQYADVRLVHSRTRLFFGGGISEYEMLNIGIRSLVNGYWGFASSPLWSLEEATILARTATQQAITNARGKPRETILGSISPAKDQHWTMPVLIDPFTVHPDEILDYLTSLAIYAEHRVTAAKMKADNIRTLAMFSVHEKALATTDGSYCTQRCYRSNGSFSMSVVDRAKERGGAVELTSLTPAAVGWELFREQPLREEIDRTIAETEKDFSLPIKPIDVGRYNILMDAWSVAHLTSSTIGLATELDRALGYESNASGSSYLNAPSEMLGTFKIGSPLLNVTGNRTDPGAVATVQWDDEGVVPAPFTLVNKGVLSNYATTREGAGWLKEYYERNGTPLRSHGCAVAGNDLLGGMHVPLAHTPNLVIEPGAESLDFDASVSALEKGIAFKKMQFDMDFQQSSGIGGGKAYEIQNGKPVAIFAGAGVLFQTSELWKNLIRLGGSSGRERFGMTVKKGEPMQYAFHSVSAPSATFKDVSVVDLMRKA